MMKIIYFCRESKLALEAIKYLNEKSKVLACFVNDTDREKFVRGFCEQNRIPVYTKNSINEMIEKFNQKQADLIISFTNTFILKKEHLAMAKNAINFHPGLLPDYRGISVGSHCLMQGLDEWGGGCAFYRRWY